jgi:hypothetical protein
MPWNLGKGFGGANPRGDFLTPNHNLKDPYYDIDQAVRHEPDNEPLRNYLADPVLL